MSSFVLLGSLLVGQYTGYASGDISWTLIGVGWHQVGQNYVCDVNAMGALPISIDFGAGSATELISFYVDVYAPYVNGPLNPVQSWQIPRNQCVTQGSHAIYNGAIPWTGNFNQNGSVIYMLRVRGSYFSQGSYTNRYADSYLFTVVH